MHGKTGMFKGEPGPYSELKGQVGLEVTLRRPTAAGEMRLILASRYTAQPSSKQGYR